MGRKDAINDWNELIPGIIGGRKDDFALIVDKYQGMVFRTCMGYLHDQNGAEDLTQEVFIQAYLSLRNFRGGSSLSTWLYRITVNACLNSIRKQRRTYGLSGNGSVQDPFSVNPATLSELTDPDDPETVMIREEHSKWLRGVLDALPENQRTAFILSKYDDLSQKEIAEVMELSEGAVESLISRAKENLRKKLVVYAKKSENDRRKK